VQGAPPMIDLDKIVKKIKQIPPMPALVLKVLEMSSDPDCSVKRLVSVIKLDQGITFRVLRLCNSAYYGLPRRVSSLKEALIFLGNNTLVNFILTSYASDFYQAPNLGYGLEAGEMWRHAVAAAIGAELIGKRVMVGDTGLLFTAALMHDVGKVILNEYVLADLERIREMVIRENCSFLEAEKAILGYTHPEVGAQVAAHWNLPPVLVNAILYHHEPDRAPEFGAEVAVVHLANTLCLMAGYGIGNDGLRYRFERSCLERFGLDIPDMMTLSADLHLEFGKAVDLIRLTEAAQ
jgi:putative nucleotidyltransferase with HDIG domain